MAKTLLSTYGTIRTALWIQGTHHSSQRQVVKHVSNFVVLFLQFIISNVVVVVVVVVSARSEL